MNLKNRYQKLFPCVFILGAICTASAGEKIVWSQGHGDLKVNYISGDWQWSAEQDQLVDHVIIRLDDVAKRQIPNLPQFLFLGAAGENIWIIPTAQTPGVPFMGINAAETTSGTFTDDRFDLLLSSLSGPGNFFTWTVAGTGTPTILMNSRDGIDAQDKASVPAGGHFHPNWAFSSPGTYRVGFKGSGILVGQSSPITSSETVYTFEVNVLKKGEADIELAFEEGALELHVHNEAAGVEYAPSDVALQVGPSAWQTVAFGANFQFLGEAGANVYVLPQAESAELLFLGLAAAENTEGIFVNDELQLNLLNVAGPGSIAYYAMDEFGVPQVLWNSKDGIDQSDTVTVGAVTHSHRNWAFTAPGSYRITVQAKGKLLSGETINSEPKTLLFEVLPPAFLEEGEVDIEFTFENQQFALAILDEVGGRELTPTEVVLVVNSRAAQSVPNDPSFSFLGAAGADTYILSQEEQEGVLFPGLAADEIQTGLFVNERIKVELVSAEGPGSFSLYAIDNFGKPTVHINNAAAGAGNVLDVAVGSHSHLNWAFSKPGEYRLNFRVSGRLGSNDALVTSDILTLSFLVQGKEAGPELNIALKDSQNLELSWESKTGRVYQVQSRSSLTSGNWTDMGTAISGTGSSKSLTIAREAQAGSFFRLVERLP